MSKRRWDAADGTMGGEKGQGGDRVLETIACRTAAGHARVTLRGKRVKTVGKPTKENQP